MKIKTIIIALLFAIGFTTAKAQTNPPKAATPPSPTAIKAAEQMLIAAGVDKTFESSILTIVDQYSTQIPEDKRAKFSEVMKQFIGKYCSWSALKDDLCMIYAHEFSESELKQLTTFYNTPLGKKLNEKQPELMKSGMLIGQQAVAAHQTELTQMLTEAMK